jgi:hypothetical protein
MEIIMAKNKPINIAVPKADKFEVNGAVTSYWYGIKPGWEKWWLYISDVHFDSVYCNREMLTRHLDAAQRRGAGICAFGDWFDAMQGRFDPRRSMAELRPEYRREDYYDFVVNDSADYLEKYAENVEILADGNHELSVLKAANTNLSDRLVHEINRRRGSHIVHGGYGGWIRNMFIIGSTRMSVRVKYFHGAGGEAPVTRGAIQTNRQSVYLPDANIVVNGHSHNSYHIPIARERLGGKGELYFDIQHHVRTPGYKQAYGDGTTGWEVTRGGVPKPLGGCWVRMVANGTKIDVSCEPFVEAPQPVSISSNEIYTGVVFNDDREGY